MIEAEVAKRRAERLRALADFLADREVQWGADDCSMLCAQWIADETGREIDWPAYDSREEAHALIDAAGGLVNVWEPCVRALALEVRFDLPEIGDVGIIATHTFGDVGVIFLHGGAAMWRADRGIRVIAPRRHTIVRAWRVA
jgi:hypothetical protein